MLFIASRFPPVASVSAIRVRKFVKYLGRFGWRPVVITGAVPKRSVRPPWRTDGSVGEQSVKAATDEESLLDLLEGLSVYRLSSAFDDWPAPLSRRCAVLLAPLTRWLRMNQRAWEDVLARRSCGREGR